VTDCLMTAIIMQHTWHHDSSSLRLYTRTINCSMLNSSLLYSLRVIQCQVF
jgi:hypothetical protein